ncbi:MAG: hypothetical protein J0M34_08360 [Alphaproteobacteria bacterium]|nr:hypothetical protein [Alphaproteobacteria bacterium]
MSSPAFLKHWQQLRDFFSLGVIKLFITWFAITPVVVKALHKLPDTIFIGERSIPIQASLPFSWEVLWVSSFCFFISYITYHWKCPNFIKRYHDFASYKSTNHSPRWIVWELYYSYEDSGGEIMLAERLIAKNLANVIDDSSEIFDEPVVEGRGTIWRFLYNGKKYEVCMSSKEDITSERELFWEIYARWADSHPKPRTVTWLGLYAAIALLAYVVVQNIISVVIYLFTAS